MPQFREVPLSESSNRVRPQSARGSRATSLQVLSDSKTENFRSVPDFLSPESGLVTWRQGSGPCSEASQDAPRYVPEDTVGPSDRSIEFPHAASIKQATAIADNSLRICSFPS